MVEACLIEGDVPTAETKWTTIVSKKPLGPHRQHYFDIERSVPAGTVFSHIRLSTYPDGGLKRLRAFGYPLAPTTPAPSTKTTLKALPLTVEAFRPFGSVVQGFSFASSAPKGTHVTVANQGTASKFHRLAMFPDEAVKAGLKVEAIRVEATTEVSAGSTFDVSQLQRWVRHGQDYMSSTDLQVWRSHVHPARLSRHCPTNPLDHRGCERTCWKA